jgi:hypothetical protein
VYLCFQYHERSFALASASVAFARRSRDAASAFSEKSRPDLTLELRHNRTRHGLHLVRLFRHRASARDEQIHRSR